MHKLIGHAIVSSDDKIADARGVIPDALHNERDWEQFQAALDQSSLIMLGRASHQASPNPRRRKRLIVSTSAPGMEQRADGVWMNPDTIELEDCLSSLLPDGGVIAVVGGQGVFDLVGADKFYEFRLARSFHVKLPGGRAVFSDCEKGKSAQSVLLEGGLRIEDSRLIDPEAGVELTIFRRPLEICT